MALLQRGGRRKGEGGRWPAARFLPWSLALLLLSAPLAPRAPAQATSEPMVSYTSRRVFRIPFQPEPGERRLREVQLYLTTDMARTWHPYATAPPDQGYFTFNADHEGWYWFAVRTVDLEGRAHPLTLDGAAPGLKVCVDSTPPVIDLRPLPSRDGLLGVAWDVRDDNLDLPSMRLDYRLNGTAEWSRVQVDPAGVGQTYWRPYATGQFEVRLRARDRADNWAERTTAVSTAADGGRAAVEAPAVGVTPRASSLPAPGDPAVHMVNSKRISLNYEIKKGPSGVSAVELWYTRDGRSWVKYPENISPTPPFTLDVSDEGLYGFTLVVRSGVGLGGSPPQVGDPPQLWVEVDLTRPVVRLTGVDVGQGADAGKLTITWEATDKNLGPQPITLSYATQPEGPWTPIASNLENSRRYVWTMPQDVPFSFLVRVEAADRAGNVGSAQWPKPVIVDLFQPKAVNLDVSPAK